MKNDSSKILYVVHCIDTEGPLAETLDATFDRLKTIFGVDLPTTEENLQRLQRGEINLGQQTDPIRRMLDPQLLGYNRNWEEIDSMLSRVSNPSFRMRLPDCTGQGWTFSWFCLDHVGYSVNPRNRDLGHHKVFDHYSTFANRQENRSDRIFFHYHPLPYNGMAHSCATLYFNANHLFEILARKIIDRRWFPTVFRPGFHTTRPDSNWFLEQWIPFEYANQASAEDVDQPDLGGGRFGDWRRAPRIWSAYHPSHDDYQTPGNCRRWIFRCLNMQARLRTITPAEVESAFDQAEQNGSAVLAFTNHDFRNMAPEIDAVRDMISASLKRRPGMNIRYADALTAARMHLGISKPSPLNLKVELDKPGDEDSLKMQVSSESAIFGPQPFLAIRDRNGKYYYDNLDFGPDGKSWHYTFDWQTFPPEQLDTVGLAATGNAGQAELLIIQPRSGKIKTHRLNYD